MIEQDDDDEDDLVDDVKMITASTIMRTEYLTIDRKHVNY